MSDKIVECPICSVEFKSELSWASHYDKKHDVSLWFDTFEEVLNKNILDPEIDSSIHEVISAHIKTRIRPKKDFKREERIIKKKKTQKRMKHLKDKRTGIRR